MQTKNKKLEQIDEIIGTSPKVQVKKKRKTKLILIIVGLLTLCCLIILGLVVFAWYGGFIQKGLCDTVEPNSGLWNDFECEKKYAQNDDEKIEPTITPTQEIKNTNTPSPTVTKEVDEKIEVIDIKLENKIIRIEMSKLLNQSEFAQDFKTPTIIQMYNNMDNHGSTGQYLTYFQNEKSMTNYYAHNDKKIPFANVRYPLETFTLSDGTKINYLDKYLTEDDDSQGGGIFYKWTPTISIHSHQASNVISYINIEAVENNNYNPTTSMFINAACIFNLHGISTNESGYLGFDGYASAGSEINYCDVLNNLDVFEISIIDN